MSKKGWISIFALAAHGEGISGGDRIFIEMARRWSKKYPVTIYVWEEGAQMLLRQQLMANGKWLMVKVLKMGHWCRFGFVICYFARIIESIFEALKLTIKHPSSTIIYSASEFWMDSLPALILKLRFPKITWAAAWYQTAPKPWIGYSEGERVNTYNFRAFLYWFVQQSIKPLISRFADFVLVNNEEEKRQFPEHSKRGKAVVVLGAVDLTEINKQKAKNKNLPKIYDCVFQGRFHPQKGVVELIDIWKRVVDKKPEAKLAMIGDGPLMRTVKLRVKSGKLEKNVKLFGYVFDGPKKYKIFSQSKIVVHPAFYDSGGMAAAEAMAFGLPCVGFNLASYKSYYPKGMVKVRVGDLDGFAKTILKLLHNKRFYQNVATQAFHLIKKHWDWDVRAREILNKIKG